MAAGGVGGEDVIGVDRAGDRALHFAAGDGDLGDAFAVAGDEERAGGRPGAEGEVADVPVGLAGFAFPEGAVAGFRRVGAGQEAVDRLPAEVGDVEDAGGVDGDAADFAEGAGAGLADRAEVGAVGAEDLDLLVGLVAEVDVARGRGAARSSIAIWVSEAGPIGIGAASPATGISSIALVPRPENSAAVPSACQRLIFAGVPVVSVDTEQPAPPESGVVPFSHSSWGTSRRLSLLRNWTR